MKTCSKCGQNLPEDSFPFKSKKLKIRGAWCRDCQCQYAKTHYNQNRDYYISKSKRKNARRSQEIGALLAEYKRTCGCACCNEVEPCALDFHHPNPDKEYNIGRMRTLAIDTVKHEIAKCVVVCANCHRKIHAGILSL